MSGNRAEQKQADRKQRRGIQQAGQVGEETWEGGGREPIDPDDIGEDGNYFGKNTPKQQHRSDDN